MPRLRRHSRPSTRRFRGSMRPSWAGLKWRTPVLRSPWPLRWPPPLQSTKIFSPARSFPAPGPSMTNMASCSARAAKSKRGSTRHSDSSPCFRRCRHRPKSRGSRLLPPKSTGRSARANRRRGSRVCCWPPRPLWRARFPGKRNPSTGRRSRVCRAQPGAGCGS